MRHRVRGRKLGRTSAPRKALIRGLARSLILNEEGRITTTVPKAKELRPFVEKLVTLAGDDADHNRRRALRLLPDKEAVNQLFEEIGPRYKERPGGYTRIMRTDKRLGDKGEKAIIEFVLDDVVTGDSPEGTSQPTEAATTIHKPTKAEDSAEDAPVEETGSDEAETQEDEGDKKE